MLVFDPMSVWSRQGTSRLEHVLVACSFVGLHTTPAGHTDKEGARAPSSVVGGANAREKPRLPSAPRLPGWEISSALINQFPNHVQQQSRNRHDR